jgi:hypothetical protein
MRTLDAAIANSRLWLGLAVFTVVLLCPAGAAKAGTAENVTGWAWSGSIGWIAMNSESLAVGYTPSFGVTMVNNPTDVTRTDLSGYGWSENVGWVCFGATCTGTTPEGGASYAQYRASWNAKSDQVFGWAKVVAWGDEGWISLNCDHDVGADECGASNYVTVLDTVTGVFTKGGVQSYAWGATNEFNGVGWVNLSGVSTSWVPARLGRVLRPEGIYEPNNAGLVGTHLTSFDISFSGFWAGAGQRVECDLLLPNGSTQNIGKALTGTVRNGITSISRTVGATESVQMNKLWYITACRIGDVVGATACAADATCLPGGFCDESLGKCRTVVATSNRRLPIYTHGNSWTGLQSDQDQYSAVKCFAGFPNNYLKNAAQCDFTGDASFSLMMRRGMPLEGNCADGLDNDGNGQIDCADRYCQGISYRCRTLPRTTCVWGQSGDGIGDCSESTYASGDLCCDRQPLVQGSGLQHVVDGMECRYSDVNDGYYDCDCVNATKFDANGTDDCFAPGAQAGDLCCDTDDTVKKL